MNRHARNWHGLFVSHKQMCRNAHGLFVSHEQMCQIWTWPICVPQTDVLKIDMACLCPINRCAENWHGVFVSHKQMCWKLTWPFCALWIDVKWHASFLYSFWSWDGPRKSTHYIAVHTMVKSSTVCFGLASESQNQAMLLSDSICQKCAWPVCVP